jgi:hypothetical protein
MLRVRNTEEWISDICIQLGNAREERVAVTNQDTILAKVFKAKYYPKDGFLDAKLGHKEDYDCG